MHLELDFQQYNFAFARAELVYDLEQVTTVCQIIQVYEHVFLDIVSTEQSHHFLFLDPVCHSMSLQNLSVLLFAVGSNLSSKTLKNLKA